MSVPQPVPPSWKDLGKSSLDLLGKEYPIGNTFLEVKTTTPSNVVFKVTGHKPTEGVIIGNVEAKYTDRKHGLTFTQAWNNANTLLTNVELDNQIVNGLKVDLAASLHPQNAHSHDAEKAAKEAVKNATLTTTYKMPGLHTRAALNVFKGPTFTADAVFGHDGFLLGTEATYNVSTGQITKYAAGVGFSAPEYAVTLLAGESFTRYSASYYHRVSRDVEAGGHAIYDTHRSTDGVKIEVGTKAYLDSAAYLKAKMNNAGVLSLGYTQALRPGVKASFGLALDTQKLSGSHAVAAHKVGASFTFEG